MAGKGAKKRARREKKKEDKGWQKRGKPRRPPARHIMFRAVADAQDVLRIADQRHRMAVDLGIRLADPGHLPAHVLVERGNGARRRLQAIGRQHQPVRIAADGGYVQIL